MRGLDDHDSETQAAATPTEPPAAVPEESAPWAGEDVGGLYDDRFNRDDEGF